MRIAFVHQNFPAQFVHLAPALARRGHEVLALTADDHRNRTTVPVARYKWKPPEFPIAKYGLAATYAEMIHRAHVTAAAAVQLREKHGYIPDVVFGTPGWGETLFLKEVWPEARHILYAEFFYSPRGLDVGFDKEFSSGDLSSRILVTARQAHLLLALNASDKLVSPTQWQAQSFPDYIRDRIEVIHDGIDTDRVCPNDAAIVSLPGLDLELTIRDEVLTFINRNLEPHRGFHIFMRALPSVLATRPHARAVIIGGTGRSYSRNPPDGKTWKQIFLEEVGDRLDLKRVHFVGKVPYATFIALMQISRVHAYLTYPFVLSWSMLEAMSAGALVIGSRTPPVEEVIEDGVNGRLVDFFDIDAWSAALIEALAEPERFAEMRSAARRTVIERFDLRSKCLPKLLEFVEKAWPSRTR